MHCETPALPRDQCLSLCCQGVVLRLGGRLMHYYCFLQEFVETNTYHTQHLLHHTSKLSHLNKFPTNSLVSSYKFITFLHYSSQTIRECRSSSIYFNSIEYRSSVRTTISPGILTKHY